MARVSAKDEFESLRRLVARLERRIEDLEDEVARLKKNSGGGSTSLDGQSGALISTENRELVRVVSDISRNMMVACAKKITADTYNKVMTSVEEQVLPKINNAMEWYNFQTQDGDVINNEYRQALAREDEGGQKMIGTGKNDKYRVSDQVRYLFDDDH